MIIQQLLAEAGAGGIGHDWFRSMPVARKLPPIGAA